MTSVVTSVSTGLCVRRLLPHGCVHGSAHGGGVVSVLPEERRASQDGGGGGAGGDDAQGLPEAEHAEVRRGHQEAGREGEERAQGCGSAGRAMIMT